MIISVLYFAIFFGIFVALLFLLFRSDWKKTVGFPAQKVPVSILIAARNEAQNIGNCLRSISRINYPSELLEVLIGDDNSTDDTYALVTAFIQNKPNFHVFKITEELGLARGKANVLAHLTKKATTGYFFITDADMQIPADWITAMLNQIKPETGIVTGITTTKSTGFFSRMQALDWFNALGLIQVVSDLKIPVTTMGNNMLVTRAAYESTGGYENLPFSITEDVQLFNEVLAKGWGFKNVYQEEVLAITAPAADLYSLLHQRKRWMKGAMHLPLFMKTILILYTSFYFVLIPFLWRMPVLYGLGLVVLKWTLQTVFLQTCLNRVNRKASLLDLILFEAYQIFTSVILVVFYFLPFKVIWKGRKY